MKKTVKNLPIIMLAGILAAAFFVGPGFFPFWRFAAKLLLPFFAGGLCMFSAGSLCWFYLTALRRKSGTGGDSFYFGGDASYIYLVDDITYLYFVIPLLAFVTGFLMYHIAYAGIIALAIPVMNAGNIYRSIRYGDEEKRPRFCRL